MSPKKHCSSSSSSSSSSCHKNLIKLYSSVNFDVSGVADTKEIKKWDINNQKIEFSTKFVSAVTIANVEQYFKANVSFEAYKNNGQIVKKNIVVRDIYFKSQVNVSASSQTDDYNYLYDISKSSADNSSSSSCSSSYSISEIVNKNIENQIATDVKNFFAGTGVVVSWTAGKGYITLNVEGVPSEFSSAKLSAKYRLVCLSSSSSSSTSSSCTSTSTKCKPSCHSSSSSSSSCSTKHKGHGCFKYIIFCALGLIVLMILLKLLKPKEPCHIQDQVKHILNELKQNVHCLKGAYTNF